METAGRWQAELMRDFRIASLAPNTEAYSLVSRPETPPQHWDMLDKCRKIKTLNRNRRTSMPRTSWTWYGSSAPRTTMRRWKRYGYKTYWNPTAFPQSS